MGQRTPLNFGGLMCKNHSYSGFSRISPHLEGRASGSYLSSSFLDFSVSGCEVSSVDDISSSSPCWFNSWRRFSNFLILFFLRWKFTINPAIPLWPSLLTTSHLYPKHEIHLSHGYPVILFPSDWGQDGYLIQLLVIFTIYYSNLVVNLSDYVIL